MIQRQLQQVFEEYLRTSPINVLQKMGTQDSHLNDLILETCNTHCAETIDHIGLEVKNLTTTLHHLKAMPYGFTLLHPIFESFSVPKRFPGSRGIIAKVHSTKLKITLELMQIQWNRNDTSPPEQMSKNVCHTALRVLPTSSLQAVTASIITNIPGTSRALPISENIRDRSRFTYIRGARGQLLELIQYRTEENTSHTTAKSVKADDLV